jgi:hypothetical protein
MAAKADRPPPSAGPARKGSSLLRGPLGPGSGPGRHPPDRGRAASQRSGDAPCQPLALPGFPDKRSSNGQGAISRERRSTHTVAKPLLHASASWSAPLCGRARCCCCCCQPLLPPRSGGGCCPAVTLNVARINKPGPCAPLPPPHHSFFVSFTLIYGPGVLQPTLRWLSDSPRTHDATRPNIEITQSDISCLPKGGMSVLSGGWSRIHRMPESTFVPCLRASSLLHFSHTDMHASRPASQRSHLSSRSASRRQRLMGRQPRG